MKKTQTIHTRDGYELEATIWQPETFDTVTLLGPAMGVKRSFYHAFAYHLLTENTAAVTFDYRGIGGSKNGPLTDLEADVTTWAREDLGGTIRWMLREFPDKKLTAVLHSLSGQILGLSKEAPELERIVTVVSGGGYWNFYPFPKNLGLAFVWYALYPIPSHLLGYFPGSALGIGEDLPRNAALEIAKWGRRSNYIDDYTSYANVTAPILAYSFTDDPYCPKPIVDYMHDQYTAADVTRRHVSPAEVENDRIGHFGFFRDDLVPELWDDVVTWLKR